MKPLYGFGGGCGVQGRRTRPEFRLAVRSVLGHLPRALGDPEIPAAVAEGDKRIILVDGEALGAVNRVPAGDDIRSNMVRGGAAAETELTAREREICARIGPELKRRGLVFVGIDVIDGYLTEINVTSPTGIRAISGSAAPTSRRRSGTRSKRKRRAVAAEARDDRPRHRRPPASRAADGRSAPSEPVRPRRGSTAQLERLRAETQRRRSGVPPRRGRSCSPPRSRPGAPRRGARSKRAAAAAPARARSATSKTRSSARIHDMAARLVHPGRGAKPRALTILAVGGYGRGMLAPGSDIDLLFLLADEKDAAGAKLIETILYVLWDLKQKVGHATRTIDECLRQARADMTIRTSVLEARLIMGDASAVRDAARALRQGDRRQDGERIRRRQARRARRARQARRRVALSRRAQRQGGQGRPARPQHAVLDRQIRLSGARSARAGRRRACSRSANSRCSRAARNSCGRCAATCISSPAAPRSG